MSSSELIKLEPKNNNRYSSSEYHTSEVEMEDYHHIPSEESSEEIPNEKSKEENKLP